MLIQTPPRTILEVFESLPEGTLAQLINNLIISTVPSFKHQDSLYKIAMLLGNHVNEKNLGKIVGAPIDVYFNEQNVCQPDILFLLNERMHIVQEDKIKGAPDLIIEVLSPGTENFDKRIKKKVYEEAGVKEYWIVDPKTKATIGYELRNNQYITLLSEPSIITSPLLSTTILF